MPAALDHQTVYSSNEVVQLCGISKRQLQWWDEHDLIYPAIHQGSRIFDPGALRWVLLVAAVRRAGVPLYQIRATLAPLRLQDWTRAAWLVLWRDGARLAGDDALEALLEACDMQGREVRVFDLRRIFAGRKHGR